VNPEEFLVNRYQQGAAERYPRTKRFPTSLNHARASVNAFNGKRTERSLFHVTEVGATLVAYEGAS